MAVEIRYHVRIHIDENKSKNSEDIDEKLCELFYCDEINDINIFVGNAACSSYIEFWCDTWVSAKLYSDLFLIKLKKQRIYAIES